jgi:hypothetical protein
VSSGQGGVFPRGVLIGTVLEELAGAAGATGWSKAYLIRPAVRPAEVTQVMVLLPERNGEGVTGVWRTPGDSIARDSLARDSAARATAARDSAARANAARTNAARRAAARPDSAGTPR